MRSSVRSRLAPPYFQSLRHPQNSNHVPKRSNNLRTAAGVCLNEPSAVCRKRCVRVSSSRALVRADWSRADCYHVTFAQRLMGQVRLPSSVAIPENQALTRKKKAPEQGAFAFSLMVESACSIPLQGVASWHSLPQKQNNGPVFLPVTAFKGARKVQSRAEIRATGRYLMRRYTPTSRSHEVQGRRVFGTPAKNA
jgi:hypothetical protein